MPRVSVIVPTYNQVRFLGLTLASILAQTFPDLEVIVVDDGSTDGTADLLKAMRDPRLRIISQENRGASGALNRGFAEARGEYRTWLASDNLYHPGFLESMVGFLDERSAVGLAYACFENVDERGQFVDYAFLEPWYPGLLLVNPGAVGVAFLYRREVGYGCRFSFHFYRSRALPADFGKHGVDVVL